jgi:phage terminase small subunit
MTKRQQTFINQYYIHRNATLAAKQAGYSQHTATQIGYDLLRKPKIKQKLTELLSAVGQEL